MKKLYENEPLIGKIVIRDGKKMFLYNDIRAACHFFLRYRDNKEMLKEDFPDLASRIGEEDYELSLFKLAFDDIFRHELTPDEEKKIQERLRELGYL